MGILSHPPGSFGPFFFIVASYLALVIILGGGGWPSPTSELVIELIALVVAALAFWMTGGFMAVVDRQLLALSAMFCAIPMFQLIPLPPALWTLLPGREQVSVSLAAAGAAGSWMPISMAPERTLAGWISLIPPLVMLWIVRILAPRGRTGLLAILVGLALLAVAVGTVQVMSAGALAHFYPTMEGYAVGFQANRNSAADLFLIGLCALVSLVVALPEHFGSLSRRAACVAIAGLLALAVVMTGSRAGILLLTIPISMGLLLLSQRGRRRFAVVAIGPWLVVPALITVASFVPMIERTLSRFSMSDGGRLAMWDDALFQIGQTFPFGSGVGTGSMMLVAAETLDRVDQSVPNRVHNDYLEWILEAGAAAIIVLAFGLIFLARRTVIALNQRYDDRQTLAQVAFAAATIAIVAAHSVVDYPVRSLSIACLSAMAVAFLPSPVALGDAGREKHGEDNA